MITFLSPAKQMRPYEAPSLALSRPQFVKEAEELSGIGAAYMAGIAAGLWDESIFSRISRETYFPAMVDAVRENKTAGWKTAVRKVLTV